MFIQSSMHIQKMDIQIPVVRQKTPLLSGPTHSGFPRICIGVSTASATGPRNLESKFINSLGCLMFVQTDDFEMLKKQT